MKVYDIRYTTRPTFALEALAKDEDGNKVNPRFEPPFDPYCYIEVDPPDKVLNHIQNSDSLSVASAPDGYVKVEGNVPWDIKEFVDFCEDIDFETYESDVPYARRVMIDEDIKLDTPDPEDILYFDIEVDPRGEFPDAEEAKQQIISIAAVDGVGNEYFICHDNEVEILEEFNELLEDYFVVSGWFSQNFDWPYIINRAKRKSVWIDQYDVIHFDLKALMAHINREERSSWSLEDVGQDEVGMGKAMQEEDYEEGWEILWDWYENDRDMLYEYNIEDCRITAAIDEKYQLINLIFRICRRGYSRPPQIMYEDNKGNTNIAVGKAADSVVLWVANKVGKVLPKRGRFQDIHEFPGGRVFDPIKGVHFNVMTADFSGMYPAIIRDFNVGLDTWIDANSLEQAVSVARDRWGDDIDEDDIIIGPGAPKIDDADPSQARGYFIKPYVQKSLIAQAIDELEDFRMEFKEKRNQATKGTDEWHKYNNIDRGLKVLMNTLYGIAASKFHRYYVPGNSANITETGQHLIKVCFDWAEENLKEVEKAIYGDTDSVMIELNVDAARFTEKEFKEYVVQFTEEVVRNPDGKDEIGMDIDKLRDAFKVITVAKEASRQMNSFIARYVVERHNSPGRYMEMDLDDVWLNYILTDKKKKYAGEVVYSDGPCAYRKIKGFKCVKANTSEAIKEFQKRIIIAKLHEEPTNEIIKEYRHKLFTGQFDYDMIQHTKLGSMPDEYKVLPAHGRAAKMMIEREGDENAVRTGDKIAYLKYGDDTSQVMPTDNGIDEYRPNDFYCPTCDEVIMTHPDRDVDCDHEREDYPHLRDYHYSYLWEARFEQTLDLLDEQTHEQTGLEAFA